MRIRQVRPEFWSDGRIARMAVGVRLTYIGLWNVADDAGWLAWNVNDLAAQIFPYDPPRVREKRLGQAEAALTAAGRLLLLGCGCACIPTLPEHQRIGGNKSFTARDRHRSQHGNLDPSGQVQTSTPLGRLGRVVSYSSRAPAREGDETDDEKKAAMVEAFRRQGLPVDA